MVLCLDRHTHIVAGNKFYIFLIMYKISAHFGASRNESLTLP